MTADLAFPAVHPLGVAQQQLMTTGVNAVLDAWRVCQAATLTLDLLETYADRLSAAQNVALSLARQLLPELVESPMLTADYGTYCWYINLQAGALSLAGVSADDFPLVHAQSPLGPFRPIIANEPPGTRPVLVSTLNHSLRELTSAIVPGYDPDWRYAFCQSARVGAQVGLKQLVQRGQQVRLIDPGYRRAKLCWQFCLTRQVFGNICLHTA